MTQPIDYIHSNNLHSVRGPEAALPVLFGDFKPSSLLDVGCGIGTWLRAARAFGIPEIFGIEGVNISESELLIPVASFKQQDLTRSWTLDKKFDSVMCFEVAEHLESAHAPILVDCLVRHGDLIYFSAACPGQDGQHHVNCQWPEYWQKLFNDQGFACSDEIRWRIWDNSDIEPWYRQNMFLARRDSLLAGKEPRLRAVVHPEMIPFLFERERLQTHITQIENGLLPTTWYARALVSGVASKLRRRM
jgi:SAM-dependent methyltransferase